jgi:acetylornithine/N-succinyldiaminopimelate aminotransferase
MENLSHNCLLETYQPLPLSFTHGEGVWLIDKHQNRYLDALCGIAVTGLGHNYPAITKAIQDQASKLLHVSNLFCVKQRETFAKSLCELTPFSKVFFCNSGAEAIEGLIKLARLYGHSKGHKQPKIIVMEKAFHGRTMGGLSASGNPKYYQDFEPVLPGFIRVPFNNINALSAIANKHKDIAAVLIEPIQGEGGIQVPDKSYLSQVREICTQQDWLMMVDEVQTGMGRTGTLFAYEQANIQPDAMALAKGLANGIPIGAFLLRDPFNKLFKPGLHGSTFGGNPLSTRIGQITLDEITKNKLWENAKTQGNKIKSELTRNLKAISQVKDIRGKGLMLGIELDIPCRDILTLGLEKRLIFNVASNTVIRLLPPLIINNIETQYIIDRLSELITTYCSKK